MDKLYFSHLLIVCSAGTVWQAAVWLPAQHGPSASHGYALGQSQFHITMY